MHERLHLIVHGRVQGVFYRKSLLDKALQLTLKGWVRNLPNGDVETVAEGEKPNLEQLILWCRKGPSGARVSDRENVTEPSLDSSADAISLLSPEQVSSR